MKLLTIPGAAKQFGFSYQELLRLVNGKHIPSIEIPGRRSKLIDPDDVTAFIASKKVGTVLGSETQQEPPQTAPNKESQKRGRSSKNSDKYSWMSQFRRKGAPCS